MRVIDVNSAWIKFNVRFLNNEMSLRKYLVQRMTFAKRVKPEGESLEKGTFWALKDINLSVREGEIVALIGGNGAGKSTMLMMLAGIHNPDRGSVRVQGKIGTLLSLGGGFHPDLNGIENIRQNGVFLGMKKRYIEKKLDDIVEYAELGDFIYAPIRTYSSGMRTRLGFAIAVHLNPDVIIIDEVLDAGDAAFRKKSSNLMQVFSSKGKTIVMASHSLGVVRDICTRAVWLDHGRIMADGAVDDVVQRYQEFTQNKQPAEPVAVKPVTEPDAIPLTGAATPLSY